MQNKTIKILCIGDLVGQPGVALFVKWAGELKRKYQADGIIVNGENAAQNGRGINKSIYDKLKSAGADVITTGNHIWAQKETGTLVNSHHDLLRPINFPSQCPGKGYYIADIAGYQVAVMNAQGRVFMHEDLSCPFQAVETALTFIKTKTNIIFLDFHAETTSEKQGMGFHFDGKISSMHGTHTHVQTADERVLPNGTAYISDLGCAGAENSMLGMKKEVIIGRFLNQMPARFVVEKEGPFTLHGTCVEVDTKTGKAVSIERVQVRDADLDV